MKTRIEYKGQVLETSYYAEMDDETFLQLQKEYYTKPTKSQIVNEIATILTQDGIKNTCITKNYFKDLMDKVVVYKHRWCIEDVFAYKPLMEKCYGQVLSNSKLFEPKDGLLANINKCLRIGGGGFARQVANFPIATMDEIFKKYNVNNNYYDMSCGWGARMTASFKNKVNYFGTDPNYELVERLHQLHNDWKEITYTKPQVDIRCQGSEYFVPEWENIMGLCFTSPPYFCLEDYKIGDQSYKDGTSYNDWLNNYLKPTIQNCYRYLIDKGYFAINIKDFDKFRLEEDTRRIAEECGFVYIENMNLKNHTRIKCDGELGDSDENIMVFMKKGFEHLHKPYIEPQQLDIFNFIEE